MNDSSTTTMGQTTTPIPDRERLTTGIRVGSLVVGTAFIVLLIAGVLRAQAAGGALQLLGIALTAFGVAVVWELLELVADKTLAAKRQIQCSSAAGRQRLRLWWLRRRGQTTPAYITGHASATSSTSAVLSVGHPSVDRPTISDRDWLAFLNDQIDVLRKELRAALERHSEELAQRLAEQQEHLRTEMRHELREATRQGWELILAGLVWSAIGTFVGMWS